MFQSFVKQQDVWVYNDIPQAMNEAKKQNKPILVTFRCVPCKDCAAFDADVATGNERVRALAKDKLETVQLLVASLDVERPSTI